MNLDLSNVLNFINGTNGQSKKTFTILENTSDFSASILDSSKNSDKASVDGEAKVDEEQVFDMLNLEQDPDVKDDILDFSEFSKYFSLENTGISESQVQELFDLMSSLDGGKGISKDELKQVMDLSQKDGFSSSDIEAFLTQIKDGLNGVVKINSGETPIGLMKKVSGADGFNKEDYKALIEMNIKNGYIKEDEAKMTEAQKEKYGVDYMLHPDMKLKIYSQEEIDDFKNTTSNDKPNIQSSQKSDYQNEDGTSSRLVCDENGIFKNLVFYGKNGILSLNSKGILSDYTANSSYAINYSLASDSAEADGVASAILSTDTVKDSVKEGSALQEEIDSGKYDQDCPVVQINSNYFYQGNLYDKNGDYVEYHGLEQTSVNTKVDNEKFVSGVLASNSGASTETDNNGNVTKIVVQDENGSKKVFDVDKRMVFYYKENDEWPYLVYDGLDYNGNLTEESQKINWQ